MPHNNSRKTPSINRARMERSYPCGKVFLLLTTQDSLDGIRDRLHRKTCSICNGRGPLTEGAHTRLIYHGGQLQNPEANTSPVAHRIL